MSPFWDVGKAIYKGPIWSPSNIPNDLIGKHSILWNAAF